MQVVESGQDDRAEASRAPRPDRRARLRRRVVLALAFGLVLAGVLGAGFTWFAASLPDREIVLDRKADGIVVLTGGSSRVVDAIELLAAGHGQRLLITGVHRATNTSEISRVAPEYERVLRCCVDLDRSALNTLGNAIGTRRWVMDRRFRSLIVVTSSYHMPRALAELSHQMPDVTLIPFPVLSERLRGQPWWESGATTRLLLSEYLKYMYALVRMRVYPGAGANA
jgi:uncharacterized SAM-binding protein YcdF (DUF218 family)